MEPKWIRLLDYISDSELKSRYARDFTQSIESQTYDFSLITGWKIFMLFIYERLWQIPNSELKEFVSASGNKDITKNYKPTALLWANGVDDDPLIVWLDHLYPSIDTNFLKRARSIHHQRKAAAHVSEMVHDIHTVDAFLKELLAIAEKIQKCHESYLKQVDTDTLADSVQELRLSPIDIDYLLQSLIGQLAKSSSFETSSKLQTQLTQMKKFLNIEHVDSILEAIQKNSPWNAYHQILHTGGASFFLLQLYRIRSEPTDQWKAFAQYVIDDFKSKETEDDLPKFNWLFKIFDLPQFERKKSVIPETETINLDDIPF